jgi:pyridoxine kinase
MPTAVLSTHTGGFEGFTFRDLTDSLLPMAEHWRREGVAFDAFYSGYLGSLEQIDIVQHIFDILKTPDTLIMVDPVFADHGRLYSRFTQEHVKGMAELCAHADIIVPNRTEAAFMLGREYKDGVQTEEEVRELLLALAALKAGKIVLTGVQLSEEDYGAACYDCYTHSIDYTMSRHISGIYHGTGDVFASFLLGGLMKGKPLPDAVKIAVNCTHKAISLTENPPRMGVQFETVLPDYMKMLFNA